MKKSPLTLIFFTFLSFANAPTTHKKPKGPVSYAVVLLLNEKQEIVLLQRKDASFGNGLYSLPGGKIEAGETASQAAQREAAEEIGIHIKQLELVHVVDRQGPETEFYVFVFKPVIWEGTPRNCEPDKHDDIRWFALDDLPKNLIHAHKQAIECYQRHIFYSTHGYEQA